MGTFKTNMNGYTLLFVFAILAVGQSMVCFKGICDHLPKRIASPCKGSTIKNGGFCGCYDVCAKQEGEECQARIIRGRIPLGTCDKDLTCQPQPHMMIGVGKCAKAIDNTSVTKRETNRTMCEQKRIVAMISMIVYPGQWFPKCDADGLFEPEQCDNQGMCFCVDV